MIEEAAGGEVVGADDWMGADPADSVVAVAGSTTSGSSSMTVGPEAAVWLEGAAGDAEREAVAAGISTAGWMTRLRT